MSWSGTVKITGHTGGRNGFPVRIAEDVVVPRVSTWEVTGENGFPDARVRVEVRDGRPECVEVWVGAKPNGRGIQSSDMRVFNIDALVSNILTEVGSRLRPNPKAPGEFLSVDPPSEDDAWAVNRAAVEARTTRRSGPSRAELERVAEIYREHSQLAPIQALMGRLGYSERTAGRRVQQAREAGLLPPTTPGKKNA